MFMNLSEQNFRGQIEKKNTDKYNRYEWERAKLIHVRQRIIIDYDHDQQSDNTL